MQTTRCFVAVPLESSTAHTVKKLINTLDSSAPKVRWVQPDQLHITLKFLGELDNLLLPQVCDILQVACAKVEPFSISLAGVGAFPVGKPPRVVWAKVSDGSEPLQVLFASLDEALVDIGISREGRAFTPHLTLGRVGRGADTGGLLEVLESQEFQSQFPADAVHLYSSTRERKGFTYDPIHTVEL